MGLKSPFGNLCVSVTFLTLVFLCLARSEPYSSSSSSGEFYTGSGGTRSEEGDLSTRNDNAARNPTHVKISIETILGFIDGLKRSQAEMYKRIEDIAKSVEFTTTDHVPSSAVQTPLQVKVNNLERKLASLEENLDARISTLLRDEIMTKYDFKRPLPALSGSNPKPDNFDQRRLLDQFSDSEDYNYRQSGTGSESRSTSSGPSSSTTLRSTRNPDSHSSHNANYYNWQHQPPTFPTFTIQSHPSAARAGIVGNNGRFLNFQIEQPFTPPPLFPNMRSLRGISTSPSRTLNLNFLPTYPLLDNTDNDEVEGDGESENSPSDDLVKAGNSNTAEIPTTASIRAKDVTPERENLNLLGTSERPYQNPYQSGNMQENESIRGGFIGGNVDLQNVIRKIQNLERSVYDLQTQSSQKSYTPPDAGSSNAELAILKEKQAEMKRSLDTVIIHFATLFNRIQKMEEKVEREKCSCSNEPVKDHLDHGQFNNDLDKSQKTSTGRSAQTTSSNIHYPDIKADFDGFAVTHSISSTTENPRMTTDAHFTWGYGYPSYPTGSNFGDYDRPEYSSNFNYDNGEDSRYPEEDRQEPSSTSSYVSEERYSEPEHEQIDYGGTYAFLKRTHKGLKALSLPLQMQKDEGLEIPGSGVSRKDISFLASSMQNLSHLLKVQRREISRLSGELSKMNASQEILLRIAEDETVKRTIRPRDCSEIFLLEGAPNFKDAPSGTGQGVEGTIYPAQNDEPVQVLCDLDWTVVQRRGFQNDSYKVNFFRNWTEYENGFGELDGDHWIGLRHIHQLTKLGNQELLIELEKWNGERAFALYKEFKIEDPSEKYKLHVGKYQGNATDSLSRHNGKKFSTFDQDNDEDETRNCAQLWKGAWWFYACHESNLNGLYMPKGSQGGHHDFGTGIVWYHWTGNYYSLKRVQIKIRNKHTSKGRKIKFTN